MPRDTDNRKQGMVERFRIRVAGCSRALHTLCTLCDSGVLPVVRTSPAVMPAESPEAKTDSHCGVAAVASNSGHGSLPSGAREGACLSPSCLGRGRSTRLPRTFVSQATGKLDRGHVDQPTQNASPLSVATPQTAHDRLFGRMFGRQLVLAAVRRQAPRNVRSSTPNTSTRLLLGQPNGRRLRSSSQRRPARSRRRRAQLPHGR